MNINMNEKKRVTLRTVSMLCLALVIGLGATSCSEDECMQEYNAKVVSQSRMSVISIDLSGMTEDVTLTPVDDVHEYASTGDVNLNGYTLRLHNVRLTVQGNLNGGGKVFSNGNYGAYCVAGSIQNNPDTSQATYNCGSLSTPVVLGPDRILAPCGLGVNDEVEIDGTTYRIQY